jgi:hypothetical protein|tara:strand:+ start:744 stop:1049 length:306 start_codon:yes stop_codon:yes gene_type:complete
MNTKAIITDLLKQKPFLRDDDNRLCTHIWYKEIKVLGYDPDKTSSSDFLRMYASNKFTLAPTIKRVRAKLQEDNIFLRGKKYYIRKGKAQEQWQTNLGYNV